MSNVTDFLAELSESGIVVEADGERLKYHPLSGPTPDQLRGLKALKPEILAHLKSQTQGDPTDNADTARESAPVSAMSVPSLPDVCAESTPVSAVSVPPPAVSHASLSYLDTLESWIEFAPVQTAWPFGISDVVIVAPADGLSKAGTEAEVTLVFGGAVRVFGITVKRTPTGRYALAFPTLPGARGKRLAVVKPCDDATLRGIEACVIAAMREKGFLLAEIEECDATAGSRDKWGRGIPAESDPLGQVHRGWNLGLKNEGGGPCLG